MPSAPAAVRFFASSMRMPICPSPWHARLRTTGAAFADAAGEDERVGAAHGRDVRPDVLPYPVAEGLDGKHRARVALFGGGLEFAHVA